MTSLRKNLKWVIFSFLVLAFLSIVVVFFLGTQSGPRIPPCEAMRPYIQYHGIDYYAVNVLQPSDLGSVVTTVGDGSNQAKSCIPSDTPVYSVKGYPTTSRLAADFEGIRLFEPISPTPTPTASATQH